MADRLEPVAYLVPTAKTAHDGSFEDGPEYVVLSDDASAYEKRVGDALHTAAQLAAEVAAERERYDALVDWLKANGLLRCEHCQIDTPETLGYWWVLRKPYLIGQHVSYGKTEDEAIAAAIRQASEQANPKVNRRACEACTSALNEVLGGTR